MLENDIELTISFSHAELAEIDLQIVVSQNLLPEIKRVEGVKQASLIPMKEAPRRAKSLSGYVLGKLKLLVNLKNAKTTITWLFKNMSDKNIEVQAKKVDKEGNSKEISLKLNWADDINIIMSEIDKFLNKQERIIDIINNTCS